MEMYQMDNEKAHVLFIDDEETFTRQLIRSAALRRSAFECHSANNETQAIQVAERIKPDVIVLDLGLSGGPESGLSLIPKLFEVTDCARLLVLTGHGDAEWGIRSINAGAASFVPKPVDFDHLAALIDDGINVARLMRATRGKNSELLAGIAALGLTTQSEKMLKALEQVAFAAATPQPVLLCGETGVGKGLVAQAIHKASKRRSRPFVRMQPSFASHDLIMSELFGHMRGSFTGASDSRTGLIEEAHGGTLFLDEIDTLPQQTQIALLEVLQEKEFKRMGSNRTIKSDFRLISATNLPFESLLEGSRLRMDFYHRIAHTVIHIPPLRERRADIPQLAQDYVSKLASEDECSVVYGLTHEACSWLAAQPWPGNVRELHAMVERGYSQAHYFARRSIRVSDFQAPPPPKFENGGTSLSEQLHIYELTIVSSVFAKTGHNYTETAKALGIDRKRLKRILARTECHL